MRRNLITLDADLKGLSRHQRVVMMIKKQVEQTGKLHLDLGSMGVSI